MSKELTEQWKNGTLEDGDYYVRREDDTIIDYYFNDHWEWIEHEQVIKEVLAPVPTYDQFVEITEKVEQLKEDNKYLKSGIETRDNQIKQLEKRLEIATKALKKKINRKYRFTVAQDVVYKALKEMKGLK